MADPDWSTLELGADNTTYQLDTTGALQQSVAALAGQARRRIDVLTPDLEASLYDSAEFLTAVRSLATRGSRTHVRFLVGDSERAIKRGHRLIELARSLTTAIDFKRPGPASEIGRSCYLLADDRGLMWQADAGQLDATVSFNDPVKVKRLRSQFDELWEEGEPDPELRRLHL